MKILPFLYERYAAYEFMFTYELDAFVFKDELEKWCEQGWDYIGAPWFDGYNNLCVGVSLPLAAVTARRSIPLPKCRMIRHNSR